jgi:hypothetical protein
LEYVCEVLVNLKILSQLLILDENGKYSDEWLCTYMYLCRYTYIRIYMEIYLYIYLYVYI